MPEQSNFHPNDEMSDLERFEKTMCEAQNAHTNGQFRQAQALWRIAELMPPDTIEVARAVRGDAASSARRGEIDYALKKAQKAYDMHATARQSATEFGTVLRATRERAASANLLGTLSVGVVVSKEREGRLQPEQAREVAQKGLSFLNRSLKDIQFIEVGKRPDQYRINVLSRLSLAHTLYGDTLLGKKYAQQAAELSWHSENKGAPTSANISLAYQLKAKMRALPRGAFAVVANTIATPRKSTGRSVALAIADNKYTGL